MSDFIEQTFSGLDDIYPGVRPKARQEYLAKQKVEPKWEARSYKKTLPNGKDVEMYTLGTLAAAIGRPLPTVRLWMKEGRLPNSPYRMPSVVGSHGKEVAGRRLYTKPMIDAVVDIFDRAGILSVSRVDWVSNRQVTTDIGEAWTKILANETANNATKE